MADVDQQKIESLGKELFDRMEGQKPSVFKTDWWSGKMLDWAMDNEQFKVNLFRFVDVFPTLNDSAQVARHLKEYFAREDQDFPTPFQWGLSKVSPDGKIAQLAAGQIESRIESMAGNFIAGQNAKEALPTLKSMWDDDICFTLDLLGEATLSRQEAKYYHNKYDEILDHLHEETDSWPDKPKLEEASWGTVPRQNVSVKITSLYSQLDPLHFDRSVEAVKKRLRPLFRKAKQRGVFINLDVEQYRYKDLTLATFKSLLSEDEFKDFDQAGVVLQAYLKDCPEDARQLCQWARDRGTPVTVRLVKGAYWDYETLKSQQEGWPNKVFTDKAKTDRCYERVTRILLDHHPAIRTAIGSHNVRSIAHAMTYADDIGIPDSDLEFQMLYGMAEPMKKAVSSMGYRLRDYVPIGEMIPGMAYLVRRLLENTSNQSWLRMSFAEGADKTALLERPAPEPENTESPAPHEKPVADNGFRNEPHRDFSQSRYRKSLKQALTNTKEKLGRKIPLVIGGDEIETQETITSSNPANPSETIGSVSSATVEHANKAVETANAKKDEWASTPPDERADLLLKVAQKMRDRRDELAAWMIYEVGKSWREADGDVCEAIDFCEYYAREMKRLGDPQQMGDLPGEHNLLQYQPRGVAAVIAPWNFPLAILTGMTTAAAVTGNTVVVKPAEQSPAIAYQLKQIIDEVGFPEGVINYLPGTGETVGQHLVEHDNVDVIAFTGSMSVGLDIIEKAGQTDPDNQNEVKKVVCEMGGKNAIIVDADADLDEAVKGVLTSAFGYQGQKCSACSRVIVHEKCYETFKERLVEATRSLIAGYPANPASFMGPVIDEEAKAKIEKYIEIGRREGTPVLERGALNEEGHFIGATIFEDIQRDDRLANEEVFGPVLALMEAEDFDEALEIANDTRYGLTGGVFSRSPENLGKARREFNVGNLYINRDITGALVHRQPFGGFKMSGVGSKAGGPDYLLQFMEPRAISENTMRQGFAPGTHL
jgi:RHH-type proline utilization regulon transcriptional repressor/proline dehydrogenase/delta 1-pyrroline-5-carboxylate dehydrogenase